MLRTPKLALAFAMLLVASCRPEASSPPAAIEEPPSTAPRATTEPPPPSPAPCVPADHRLCPSDEGSSDPTFAAFRDNMRDAVTRKDATKLLTMVDPNIRTTFGEGGGIDDFRSTWNPDSPSSSLWPELEAILRMGGRFSGEGDSRGFWAPYVYASWPEQFDAFAHVAAIRAGVPVHAEASEEAARIATLDWDIVERSEPPRGEETWVPITTRDGKAGFVRSSDVRSPVGWRAGFNRIGGAWKMNALVAGD